MTSDETPATTEPGVIVSEVRVEASPETIFPFFTDPTRLVQRKGVSAELDPRPGGGYRCNVNGVDIASGEYVVIEPPRRVVFTWGWEGAGSPVPPGSSTVEITLTPDGASTIVRLTHRDLPAPAQPDHKEGWDHYLARLAVAASGGDPGPDLLMRRREAE
jgi:uncharacterized protein YndB with AHSA1/START domain